jgi:transglutaminase superfamily protein/coenzyme PQQ synthesis protein D (PqqD)
VITSVISSAIPAAGSRAAYRLAPDVLLLGVADGSARLLDLSGNFVALNETAAAIVEWALRARQPGAVEALAASHGVAAEQMRGDTDAVLDLLERQGLVVAPGAQGERNKWQARLAGLFVPLLRLCILRAARPSGGGTKGLLALAWFACRTLGWSTTVRVWIAAKQTRPRPLEAVQADEQLTAMEEATRRAMAGHLLPLGCKERALCCFAQARSLGLPARIVLGVNLYPFGTHVWCESGSRLLADRHEGRCEHFTPVLTYGEEA